MSALYLFKRMINHCIVIHARGFSGLYYRDWRHNQLVFLSSRLTILLWLLLVGYLPVAEAEPVVNIKSLQISQKNTQNIYVLSSEGKIINSNDGGKSWEMFIEENYIPGLPTLRVHALALDPENPKKFYVGNGSGLWVSTNSGKSWTKNNDGLIFLDEFDKPRIPHVDNIAINPLRPEQIIISTYGPQSEARLFRSEDAGKHWQLVYSVIVPEGYIKIDELIYDPIEVNNIFASTTVGLLKSMDEGKTWKQVYSLLKEKQHNSSDIPFRKLRVTHVDKQRIFAEGLTKNLIKSEDGGVTWQEMEEACSNYTIAPSAPNILYANCIIRDYFGSGQEKGSFIKSQDHGQTWSIVEKVPHFKNLQLHKLTVDPINPNIIYAGRDGGGLYKSKDGGKTWRSYKKGLIHDSDFVYFSPLQQALLKQDTARLRKVLAKNQHVNEFLDPSKGFLNFNGLLQMADSTPKCNRQ